MGVTAIHLVHKKEFEPVVRIEENVKLLVPGGEVYGKVVYLEPIQPFVIDLGGLPAATPTQWPAIGASKELNELELGEREFGQWRLLVLDDILLEVKLPAAVGRFVKKSGATQVSRLSLARDQFTEVYTYRDTVPTVVPLNPNFYNMDMARLMITGYRYVIEPLDRPPRDYTVIPVRGVATTERR